MNLWLVYLAWYQRMPLLVRTKSPAVARVGPTVLVVTDFAGYPSSVIFMSSERAYATFY